ncbi:hypothetical protein [Gemmata sp.]|uniref:hypothetical protein n=1 Tax=Gemmata sp. TaxID=1914242 RepID=UPI003F6E4CA9
MKTLPVIARGESPPLDVDLLRKIARTDPDLKALGTRIGAAKAYSDAEVRRIVAAYRKFEVARGVAHAS